MTTNPIVIGFPWSQAFDFPTGFFQTLDQIRAEFRYLSSDPTPAASMIPLNGANVLGNRVILNLTEAQTAPMAERPVSTNLVLLRDGAEFPIGVIITVPVVKLFTRADPT